MSKSRRLRSEQRRNGTLQPDADKQSEFRLKMSPDVQKVIAILLVIATIAGLYLGLLLAFIYPVTSDNANAGLFPMEIMQGHFEYVLPANNPYIFTDYIFHLVIQPLTGYSPVALILTDYAMYVLIVLVSAALVLRLAGRLEALAAAALVANTSFWSLRYVLYPLYHNGTILFILLSILVIYADRPPLRLGFRWRVLIVTLLQFLGVFSDTLMLPVFTLPLIVYSAYRLVKDRLAANPEEKSNGIIEGSPVIWLASTVPALIVYALKTRVGQLWPGGPILAPAADLGSPGSLLQHPEMLSEFITNLIHSSGDIFVAIALLIAVILAILGRKDRFLQAVLVFGGIFMMIGFMSMTMAGNPGRYLTPIVILALIVAATGTLLRRVKYVTLILVFVILLVNIGTNVQLMNQPHPDFLQLQQGLVAYLESKNITHAYSDYWTANIYTYVSGGKVMIEPVYVQDGRLKLQTMNTAPRWASVWPDGNDSQPVIITMTGDSLYDWTQEVNKDHPPVASYQVSNGWIYVYNGTLPT